MIKKDKIYCRLRNLLLKAIKKEDFSDELDFVTRFYRDDFYCEMLCIQLHVLAANFPPYENSDIHSIIMFLKQRSASQGS